MFETKLRCSQSTQTKCNATRCKKKDQGKLTRQAERRVCFWDSKIQPLPCNSFLFLSSPKMPWVIVSEAKKSMLRWLQTFWHIELKLKCGLSNAWWLIPKSELKIRRLRCKIFQSNYQGTYKCKHFDGLANRQLMSCSDLIDRWE